jgi:hypothetical protein
MDAAACSPAWLKLWWQRYATDTRRPVGGSIRRAQKAHRDRSANPALLTYYLPLRSSARTRRLLLVLRPYQLYCVALARGTSAPPRGCVAVHRSGNNSWVLAVPRSICVRTLSKLIPTSRSILSELATSDIKLALRTLARRDPMNNQFLRPIA